MDQGFAELSQRIDRMQRNYNRLLVVLATLVLAVVAAALAKPAWAQPRKNMNILRARGVVIEDSNGVARVVLGAPTSRHGTVAGERVRIPVYGMLVNDEKGRPRIAISSPEPDPISQGKVVQRRMRAHGITFHDQEGNERGGLGYGDIKRAEKGVSKIFRQ